MDTIKMLLIITTLQGRIHSKEDERFCSYQRGFIPVEEGGSVTISCSFSYFKEGENTQLEVNWRSGQSSPCGVNTNAFIYNYTNYRTDRNNFTHTDYTGRISKVEKPTEQNTTSIRIEKLKTTDGPMFCCRVDIIKDGKIINGFFNRPGTYLRFPGQTYVDQVDIVPANRGETVIIPCDLHKPSGDKETVQQVIWFVGDSDLCQDNNIEYRWESHNGTSSITPLSLVDFPKNISLRITGVTAGDERWYCCQVTTRNTSSSTSTYKSAHGTELVIVNSGVSASSKLTVEQPAHSSVHTGGSVTLTCSFKYSEEINPMWTGVYWRIESLTGDYAYHPSQERIHPTYRDRTGLTGQGDLIIHNVQETDNTTYYCLVILRECVGKNKVYTEIVQGQGTRLNTTAGVSLTGYSSSLIIILSMVLLLFVVIMCGILIFLYKRGILCKRSSTKNDANPLTASNPPPIHTVAKNEAVYESTTHEQKENTDTGGVLYAQLNMPSLNKGKRNRENPPEDGSQILYAAVKNAQS